MAPAKAPISGPIRVEARRPLSTASAPIKRIHGASRGAARSRTTKASGVMASATHSVQLDELDRRGRADLTEDAAGEPRADRDTEADREEPDAGPREPRSSGGEVAGRELGQRDGEREAREAARSARRASRCRPSRRRAPTPPPRRGRRRGPPRSARRSRAAPPSGGRRRRADRSRRRSPSALTSSARAPPRKRAAPPDARP